MHEGLTICTIIIQYLYDNKSGGFALATVTSGLSQSILPQTFGYFSVYCISMHQMVFTCFPETSINVAVCSVLSIKTQKGF